MSIVQDVQSVWKGMERGLRKMIANGAMRCEDAALGLRCKIVRNLARGEAASTIARILQCSESHVYRVAHRFLGGGLEGLADRRAENGNLKVHEGYVAVVLEAVAGSPPQHGYQRSTWTQELLILAAHRRTQIKVSVTTMSRLLASLGVRHGRPKPTVACPWSKAARKRRLRQIRRLERSLSAGEVLLHLDEVDIHLNPKIGPDYMLRGQQKEVLTPGKNEKRYIAGALNVTTGRLTWVEAERKTSALFISLVDHLVTKSYAHCTTIHLVLDNFRIHTSKAVELARLRWGDRVRFHFLPPYCPDHNRIERLWKDLHDNVTRNHTCTTMDHLMRNVRDYLEIRRRSGKHRYAQAV
jgi:transposase